MREKITFTSNGHELAGLLEAPDDEIKFYALFAHCFTCGKDIAAASRISRALNQQGIAVMRFDFTGLGNSDGDFANTNFSSNVQDLIAAAEYLQAHYQAPRLLIGHSLGGAAVIAAAPRLESVAAVATVGAPSDAAHVAHNFGAKIDEIDAEGAAKVNLAGREFTIKKQFLDDINNYGTEHISKLKRALLVMHSPIDSIVNIKEAEKIYHQAKHPKSFVSLDDADHLLSKREDSQYVAQLIASWALRYVKTDTATDVPKAEQGAVLVSEKDHVFTQNISAAEHTWLADEPKRVGGANLGPDPYQHLLAGLGACTSMTLRLYANRKKIPLEHVAVSLKHTRDYLSDCEHCEQTGERIEAITREITLVGDLTDEQRQRLLEIADKCPVHKTIHSGPEIVSKLKP